LHKADVRTYNWVDSTHIDGGWPFRLVIHFRREVDIWDSSDDIREQILAKPHIHIDKHAEQEWQLSNEVYIEKDLQLPTSGSGE
jgi:hypothetical protein